ncbi:MAG: transcriptional regulator, TetR family [Mucilaginibacter sp.]|nr:transcriptional regulator, TetR family [Mucilaginibacter sp.]
MSKATVTRIDILQKSFDLIYVQGYQATSIDHIISHTNLTKGAFYYHFKNKEDMGLAMINELIYPATEKAMILPLQESGDFVEKIFRMMEVLLLKDPFFKVAYGCPTINLIDEMAPLNEAFKLVLQKLVLKWQDIIQLTIQNEQKTGTIKKTIHAKQVALFITSSYGGVRNMGKIFGEEYYLNFLPEFKNYLEGLRA